MTKARTLANFISDGSPLADGTISVSEVSGAAPLASPNFTGNLTVDTDTLFVDAGNNVVGMGISNPSSYYSNNLVVEAGNEGGLTLASSNTTNSNYFMFADASSGNGRFAGYVQYDHNTDTMILATAEAPRLHLDGAEVTVNEGSYNTDFRVESDINTHALFVDAGNNQVVVGTSSPITGVGAAMTIGGSADTRLAVDGSSSSGIYLTDSGAQGITIRNASGDLEFYGVATREFVFNEGSLDTDFRVESDNNSHMLFVDASTDRIGINNSSPDAFLDISGTGATTSKMFEISTGGVGGGPTSTFYGGYVQVQANNNATDNFGWYVTANHSGIDSDTTGIYGQATMSSSSNRSIGTYGVSSVASAAVHNTPGTANSKVAAGVYAEAITTGTSSNSTNAALIANNKTTSGNLAYGAFIKVNAGATNPVPLAVDYNGYNVFDVTANDATFNEDSADRDFRVEADSNTHALFVDAGYNSGKGAAIVGSSSAPITGVDYNIAASMLKYSDAQPIMATGAAWHFPSVPSNRQAQANRWKFGGFTMPYHQVNAFDAGGSYAKFVCELPNGGPSGKTNLELFEIGFNYGWSGGFYMVELYQNYYTNSGYKRYQFDGGYNPTFNLHQNYGNNGVALNVLSEGTFQDGTSSVPSTATDGSYYRKTVRASYGAYLGGMVVLTVPSWNELTLNNAEVDNGQKIRLLNPQ